MSTIQEVPPKAESDAKKQAQHDAHRDPLSGRAGAHPVGTGVGAAAGGITAGIVTGAAIGTVAGPVGTAVGAAVGVAVGAIGGGLAGKAIAEEIDPTVEHGFWRGCYASRSYFILGMPYEEYAPAYEYGWVSQAQHKDKSFDQAESLLRSDWDKVKGVSKLRWDQARHAVRDSWNRVAKA